MKIAFLQLLHCVVLSRFSRGKSVFVCLGHFIFFRMKREYSFVLSEDIHGTRIKIVFGKFLLCVVFISFLVWKERVCLFEVV